MVPIRGAADLAVAVNATLMAAGGGRALQVGRIDLSDVSGV